MTTPNEYDENGFPIDAGYETAGREVVPGTQPCPGYRVPPLRAEYVDIAALLAGGLPDPVKPDVLRRSDGVGLFYSSKGNTLFGESESGKTWIALCAICERLNLGGKALFLDLDHNGEVETVQRLIALGAPVEALEDVNRFRYIAPNEPLEVHAVVEDCKDWNPDFVLIDSIGELMALFKANSNSPDEFTTVHTNIVKPLFVCGAAVVLIDHLAKSIESKAAGPTGTAAKKRVLGGTSLRVTTKEPFRPGSECTAYITITKDRPGGLRGDCPPPSDGKESLAAVFTMEPAEPGRSDSLTWQLRAPKADDKAPDDIADPAVIKRLSELDPPPTSGNDAFKRLGGKRAVVMAAYKAWSEGGTQYPTQGQVPGTTHWLGSGETIDLTDGDAA